MSEWSARLVACLAAFLLGSIPFGLILSKLGGADLRGRGSGNIGSTNVSRVLGFWPWGFFTFVLDFAKSAVPISLLSLGWLENYLPLQGSEAERWAVALFCVLGHCYTPWLRFKGGKGVATGFGAILVLSPWAALAGIVAFGLVFAATRTGSLSSLSGVLAAAVAHLVFAPLGPHLWLGALLVLVILYRHDDNLDALLQSRENTFG